jgi:major type 1 subunit fimbrin (pilin)
MSTNMKKKLTGIVISAMSLAAAVAHAAPASNGGVATFNGQLTSTTCTVTGNSQGTDFTVKLPTISTAALSTAGSTAGSTGFNIALTNCPAGASNVHTFWNLGTNTLSDGNLLNGGTATKVEVQLVDYNNGQNVIDVSKADGTQNSKSVGITAGAANLTYAAQYVSPTGGAGAGSVTTNVTYSMIYQ